MPEQLKVIAVYDNENFSEPIEYTLNLILSTYGISYEVLPYSRFKLKQIERDATLIISYARKRLEVDSTNRIHIYASDFFGSDYLKPGSMPGAPLSRYQGLPLIYRGRHDNDIFVEKSQNTIYTNIDIIASSFFMVSRYEEVLVDTKDQYGRFPALASLAYQEGFLGRPIVNEYIELLWAWIDSFGIGLKRKRPWGNKDFAVCLTHDMDGITKYRSIPPLLTIKSAIEVGDISKGWMIWIDYLKNRAHIKADPYHDAFDHIMNIEKSYGFASSFYFKADGEQYSLDDHYLKEMIMRLQENGFEVGIHPGNAAYNKNDILTRQKEKLDKIAGGKISGGRQHFLKFKIPESWRTWQAAGCLYDATLGFADYEGFRCGICHPFRPFDVIENKVMSLWEVPLTVMDGTLSSYRKLMPIEADDVLIDLIEVVERYNGLFVLLWHNDHTCELFWPGWSRSFEKFCEMISRKNAFVGPAVDMIEEWRTNLQGNGKQ